MGYHVIDHVYPSRDKERTKQSSVCGVRVNTVHYGKRKLPLGKILGETFVRRVLVPSETRQLYRDGSKPYHPEDSYNRP